MIESEYSKLLKLFIQQNVEAEAYQRKAERVKEYERGRSDIKAAIEFGAVPTSFQQPVNPPAPIVSVYSPSPAPYDNLIPEIISPTFSVALTEYCETAEGNKGSRRDVELIVQFRIDQMGDNPVHQFTTENAKQLDKMLPDLPTEQASLATNARHFHRDMHMHSNMGGKSLSA